MKVDSVVRINAPVIKDLNNKVNLALAKTGEALHTKVVQDQVMPRDTGQLQNIKTFVDLTEQNSGKVSLVTEGPYARRLYYHPEYNFKHTENPNAKGRWLDDYMSGGSKQNFIPAAFKRLLQKELGT